MVSRVYVEKKPGFDGEAKALERELREGVAPEDCEGAFICASAWLAAAALTDARLGGAEELSSLRAGDVTIEVRGGANSERAAALRRSALPLRGRTSAS